MSKTMEDDIKRWMAKRKSVLVLDIIQGKATISVPEKKLQALQHASRVIGDWIRFYNHQRPHQTLKMKTPAQAYALAT